MVLIVALIVLFSLIQFTAFTAFQVTVVTLLVYIAMRVNSTYFKVRLLDKNSKLSRRMSKFKKDLEQLKNGGN